MSHYKNLRSVFGAMVTGTMLTISAPAQAVSLNEALSAALVNSADLAAARQDWVAARENIGTAVATSEWRGTGTVTGTQSRARTGIRTHYKQSQKGSASIAFSRNLYDGGQTDEAVRAGQLTLDATQARYEGREQQLLMAMVDAYLAVAKANQDVALNTSNINRLEAHVAAAEVRLRAGAATPTRLAEAKARLARGKTLLIGAETALANAQDDFRTLSAIDPVALVPLTPVQGLPGTLLEAEEIARTAHPSVKAAIAAERAAEQGYSSLLASVKPTLSLKLSATDTQATGKAQDKTDFAAQLQFSTPLLVSGATKAKSRNVTAKIAAAKYARDDAMRAVALDVRKAFRSLQTAQSQIDAVAAELAASRLVADGIGSEVEFGQKTSLDLQDAEQDVIDAELRMVSAQHNLLLSSYRLQAALGNMTADAMGLGAVLGDLDALPAPKMRVTSIMSLLDN